MFASRVRAKGLDWTIVTQICICVIPSMVTIDLSLPRLGGEYLIGTLTMFLGYYAATHDRYRFLSLLFGCAPALALMRGEFFYNSIIFFVLLGFVLCAFDSWNEVLFVWNDPIWRWLAILCTFYWFLTFLFTGYWANNVRMIEFALASGAFCVLSNRRSHLATAFLGMFISVSAYAIAMLPYGVRLGEGDLDSGETIGNPILIGVPSALIVLLALSDRGRYLLLESNLRGRLILCLIAAQWLILSTSRGSWLIASCCLVLVFVFNKQSRKPLLLALIVAGIIGTVVLSTGRGAKSQGFFDKTFDSNRTLANRTNGRSRMWEAVPAIFAVSPIWGWGPGSGRDVDYLYTHRHLLFHSLYLQVIVETGLLGTIPLFLIIGAAVARAVRHLRRFGEVVPLTGIVAFILLGLSVSAFDISAGIFFGMALMTRELRPRLTGRRILAQTTEENQLLTV
jgi:O-antigen ligase